MVVDAETLNKILVVGERVNQQFTHLITVQNVGNTYTITFICEDLAPSIEEMISEFKLDMNQLFRTLTFDGDTPVWSVLYDDNVDISDILQNVTAEVV